MYGRVTDQKRAGMWGATISAAMATTMADPAPENKFVPAAASRDARTSWAASPARAEFTKRHTNTFAVSEVALAVFVL